MGHCLRGLMVNAVFHLRLSLLVLRYREYTQALRDTVVRLSPSQPHQVHERLVPSSSTAYVVASWIHCLSSIAIYPIIRRTPELPVA